MAIQNRYVYDELKRAKYNNVISSFFSASARTHITEYLKDSVPSDALQEHIDTFSRNMKRKWNNVYRNRDKFEKANSGWLDSSFYVPPSKQGRPEVAFSKASAKTKQRKTETLTDNPPDQLLYAASTVLKKSGRYESAKIAKDLSDLSPADPKIGQHGHHTPDKALAIMLDCGLTKSSYQQLRNCALEAGCNLYPTYNMIRESKERCLPDDLQCTELSAEVGLQSLLDLTVRRINELSPLPGGQQLTLISKTGFDGASGQSVYKQAKSDRSERDLKAEENLFITSLVPLQLTTPEGEMVWKNPRPSSTRYCRPIRFKFVKESSLVIQEEADFLKDSIMRLQPTHITEEILVYHDVKLTMIDGKVTTTLSDVTSSSQCCSLCGASPKEMNNISSVLERPLSEEGTQYGLSTLHAWIRCMECLLHIAYKMPIKKWKTTSEAEKTAVKKRKEDIQKEFCNETGLVIDRPRQGGSGTSNDGNTARRFFADAVTSARILGIDVTLTEQLHTILSALSSGFDIDPDKFKQFSLETANLYCSLYPWYYMPQSLHKILIHGHTVIRRMCLPIGMLSEDAQESRNKDFRKFRENFTRKCSRVKTMKDLMRRLLCSSDPLISTLRSVPSMHKSTLPAGVAHLLSEHNV